MTELTELLRLFEDAPADQQTAIICLCVAEHVPIAEDELNGAIRRAQLLLAAGGDPRRALDLDGRAVTALADDLDDPERRVSLAVSLAELVPEVDGLPGIAATLEALREDDDRAWREFAGALLVDALT